MAFKQASFDITGFATPVSSMFLYDVGLPNAPEKVGMLRATHPEVNFLERPKPSDEWKEGGWLTGGPGSPRVVLLGDSHGCMWASTLAAVTASRGITTSFYAALSVPVTLDTPVEPWLQRLGKDQKRAFDGSRKKWIERWQPDVVFVAARWEAYQERDVRPLLDFLATRVRAVVLIEQPPQLAFGERSCLHWLCFRAIHPQDGAERSLPASAETARLHGRALVGSLARDHPNCHVLQTHDIYAREQGKQALALDGRTVVYIDHDHLSDHGASLARHRFEAVIDRFLPDR